MLYIIRNIKKNDFKCDAIIYVKKFSITDSTNVCVCVFWAWCFWVFHWIASKSHPYIVYASRLFINHERFSSISLYLHIRIVALESTVVDAFFFLSISMWITVLQIIILNQTCRLPSNRISTELLSTLTKFCPIEAKNTVCDFLLQCLCKIKKSSQPKEEIDTYVGFFLDS